MAQHVIKSVIQNVISQYVTNTMENVCMDVRLVSGHIRTVISLAQRTVWTKHVISQHLTALMVVHRVFMERHASYHAAPHVLIANVNESPENVP